ncbi:MAG TPA: hypothetical protein VF111_10375 [Thermoanaerobaculia bacterium]
MKPYRFVILLTLVVVATSSLYAADFGVRAGRFRDTESEFIGAELVIDAGMVNLNPNIEYFLDTADDVTAGTANLDFTFDIGRFARFQPYAGLGVGLLYADNPNFGGTETDLVGNAIGGVVFDLDFLEPYAQVKYFRVLEDQPGREADDISLAIGLRF